MSTRNSELLGSSREGLHSHARTRSSSRTSSVNPSPLVENPNPYGELGQLEEPLIQLDPPHPTQWNLPQSSYTLLRNNGQVSRKGQGKGVVQGTLSSDILLGAVPSPDPYGCPITLLSRESLLAYGVLSQPRYANSSAMVADRHD